VGVKNYPHGAYGSRSPNIMLSGKPNSSPVESCRGCGIVAGATVLYPVARKGVEAPHSVDAALNMCSVSLFPNGALNALADE
jgi:hypothetical protein